MKNEMKNCGLIALSNIVEIKNITIRTLILLAKDNGLKLYAYKIPLSEINSELLPAIFESEGHLTYAKNIEEINGLNLTGNFITTKLKNHPYKPLSKKDITTSKLGTWVAVGVGASGLISGGIKSSKEAKKKKRIAKEIANQKEVPLDNVADGLQVSTLGSDLQKQEQARLNATQTDALAQAGTRAIGVGIGRVNASSQDLNAKIAADLDAQKKDISMLGAQDRGNIRQTKEQRQQAKLAALSSQYNASTQAQSQAQGNMIQGLGMAGGALSGSGKLSGTSSVTGKNTGQFSSDKYQIKKSIKDY